MTDPSREVREVPRQDVCVRWLTDGDSDDGTVRLGDIVDYDGLRWVVAAVDATTVVLVRDVR